MDELGKGEIFAYLLQRVTALANEAVDTDTALSQAIRDICETMAWPAGQAFWVEGEDDVLRPVGPRYIQSGSSGDDVPLPTDVAPRDGLWAVTSTVRPVRGSNGRWIGVPVPVGGNVVAVLQFVATEATTPTEELLQTLADLGKQLGLLVERNRIRDQLEAANSELERSNRELEQFAYIASHDLQEPLRKIIGFSDLLTERYADRLDGEAKEFFGYVVDAAYRMRELITDLLAYSRAGRRRPAMSSVDLGEVVEHALSDLVKSIDGTDVTVEVEGTLPHVHGNASELRELVVNLVSNAVKYQAPEPLAVTLSAKRTDDGWWQLTVRDNGIGIDPSHHDRIFDVFQRLHTPGAYEGTGIGLAVCRQIADHHGGRLWVESELGQGASFHLTLPPAANIESRQ